MKIFMKIFSVFLAVIFVSFLFAKSVDAKVLPQSAKGGNKVFVKTNNSTIGVYPKLRADRRALIVSFTNLQNAKAVSYQLIYKTSEQEEGAMGGLNLTGKSNDSVELLFGTCSKNVCRYHTGIHEMRLEVSYTSINGKKYLKKFRIKV